MSISVAVLATLIPGGVSADAGGGSGNALTPYARDEVPNEARISEVKALAATRRAIRAGLRIRDTHVEGFGQNVAFMMVKDSGPVSPPAFLLSGVDTDGSPAQVDLSELASFRIVKIENRWFRSDRALIEATLFPAITPRELIEARPTFTDLENRYTQVVSLWVEIEREGAQLCLMSENRPGGSYERIARLRDIEPDSPVRLDFSYGGERPPIWWAVESVIADDRYPFRYAAAR